MSASLIGLVSVALSLSGFGIDANPKAPSGDEVVSYAPRRADFMIYFDVQAVAPKNYRALKELMRSRELRQVPELANELRKAMQQAEMGLGMVKGTVGVDLVEDIGQVAAWVSYPRRGEPQLLVHVRGNFPADFIDKVATTTGSKGLKVAGRTAIVNDEMMLTSAPDGSLLFGTPALVKSTARRGPRRRPPGRGTAGHRAARMLDEKPFMAFVSSPSRGALARLQREMATEMRDNAFADLIAGHTFAAAMLSHDGVGWTYSARTRAGVRRAKQASTGLLQLMRASHYATRGFANLFFAAVDSYRGKDSDLDNLIQVKGELMKLIDEFTGNGKFRERIVVDGRTVSVQATGKHLSDVMPFAGALPVLAGGAWALIGVRQAPMPPPQSSPAPPVRRPRSR